MTKKLFLTMTLFASAATMFVACGDKDDDNEPEVVDLGLPSGTLWAKTNLGAKKAWDFGDYFAWGETQPKTDYSWETYKYCDGTDTSLTKYCYNAICGKNGFTDIVGDFDFIEGLTTLELADDAATAVLGAGYSMPTEADWGELRSQCYWEWTWNYGGHNVSGYMVFKAKSDSEKGFVEFSFPDFPADNDFPAHNITDPHIFLPATGIRTGLDFRGFLAKPNGDSDIPFGNYWASSIRVRSLQMESDSFRIELGLWPDKNALYVQIPDIGGFYINGEFYINITGPRCHGHSIRPVKRP